jgi:osmotically-inducible protein OsmY
LALNSGEWFFRFFILDHFSHHAIHFNNWSEIPRPPLVKAHPNTAKISEDISHALHRNYFTDENVKVTATGGKVRLTGHVPSWSDRGLAFSTAWMAPGVTSVQNDISVA